MIEVPAVTLDAELSRLGFGDVDFVKMDVEGSEIEALKGCDRILKNGNVKLSIASYHVVGGQETAESVEEILMSLGYSTKTEFPQHKITYGQRGLIKNADVRG